MTDELILVDIDDRQIGTGEKLWIHREGRLHRAFSVFVMHENKMLIQQRNLKKYHSGGLWANACCSHPRHGEELKEAVDRRLLEEMGIRCGTEEIFHFIYRSVYENGLSEYEYDHVFLADYDGEISPDPEEISAVRWIAISDLKQELVFEPEKFSSWFLIAAPHVIAAWEGLQGNGG